MGRCLIKLGLRLNRQTPPFAPPPCVELSRLKTASIGVPVRRWAFSHAAENAEKRSRPSSRPAARPPGPASCLRSVLLIHLSCPHPRRIFRRGDLGKCPLAGYAVAAQQARHPATRPPGPPQHLCGSASSDSRMSEDADSPMRLLFCPRISSRVAHGSRRRTIQTFVIGLPWFAWFGLCKPMANQIDQNPNHFVMRTSRIQTNSLTSKAIY